MSEARTLTPEQQQLDDHFRNTYPPYPEDGTAKEGVAYYMPGGGICSFATGRPETYEESLERKGRERARELIGFLRELKEALKDPEIRAALALAEGKP